MTQPQEIEFVCPYCGAANHKAAVACSLCGRVLVDPSPPRDEPRDPCAPPIVPPIGSLRMSIGSLLLMIALIAVCLGIAKANLFLGIAMSILAVPALVRTLIVGAVRNSAGLPMDTYAKVRSFFVSLVLMTVIAVAAGTAFFASCYTIAPSMDLSAGLLIGALVAAAVSILLFVLVIRHALESESPRGNRR